MGMFDYIVCDYPLPDGFDSSGFEFQTKDTESQYMDTYVITAEGRLMEQEYDAIRHEPVPPDKWGWTERANKRLVDTNYHGDIEFHGSTYCVSAGDHYCTQDDKPPVERSYTARFTDGQLQSITLDSNGSDRKDDRVLLTREESARRFREKHKVT